MGLLNGHCLHGALNLEVFFVPDKGAGVREVWFMRVDGAG